MGFGVRFALLNGLRSWNRRGGGLYLLFMYPILIYLHGDFWVSLSIYLSICHGSPSLNTRRIRWFTDRTRSHATKYAAVQSDVLDV